MRRVNELHQVVAEAAGGPGNRDRLDFSRRRRVGPQDAVAVELVEALSAVGKGLEVEAVSAPEIAEGMHFVVDVDRDLGCSGRSQLEL